MKQELQVLLFVSRSSAAVKLRSFETSLKAMVPIIPSKSWRVQNVHIGQTSKAIHPEGIEQKRDIYREPPVAVLK